MRMNLNSASQMCAQLSQLMLAFKSTAFQHRHCHTRDHFLVFRQITEEQRRKKRSKASSAIRMIAITASCPIRLDLGGGNSWWKSNCQLKPVKIFSTLHSVHRPSVPCPV